MYNNMSQKNSLARLMAGENISVEQNAGVNTSYFDLKERKLILPVLDKTASSELQDLYIGHEVSHALHTDLGEINTLIDKVSDKYFDGKKDDRLKKRIFHSINIVEDIRIEKIIKRKYPGLNRPFNIAYYEMAMAQYKTNPRELTDPNTSFIERINRQFKIGAYVEQKFFEKEEEIVSFLKTIETFKDVEEAIYKIYDLEKDKENQDDENNQDDSQDKNKNNKGNNKNPGNKDKDEERGDKEPGDEETGDGDDEDDSDNGGKRENEGQNENGDEEDQGQDSGSDDSVEEEQKGASSSEGINSNSVEEEKTQKEIRGSTPTGEKGSRTFGQKSIDPDKIFKDFERSLKTIEEVAQKKIDRAALKRVYFSVPRISYSKIMEKVVTPEKYVQETAYYKKYSNNPSSRNARPICTARFKAAVKNNISFLTKEFELKKAAEISKKTRIERTGVLNTNRMHKFAYSEDIFSRREIENKGKNHGLVFLIDWSGSMESILKNTIYQLLDFVLFCRKNNIPFEVFLFRNEAERLSISSRFAKKKSNEPSLMYSVQLVNCLSSSTPITLFNECIEKLLDATFNPPNRKYHEYALTGTPLNDALAIMPEILNEFKRKNKLQCVSFVVLSDGDSGGMAIEKASISSSALNIHVLKQDREEILLRKPSAYHYPNTESLTEALMKRVKLISEVNTVCFFICPNFSLLCHKLGEKNISKYKDEFISKNMVILENVLGYDKYFFVKPFDDILKAQTGGDILQNLADKKKMRIISSEFIDTITKNL